MQGSEMSYEENTAIAQRLCFSCIQSIFMSSAYKKELSSDTEYS